MRNFIKDKVIKRILIIFVMIVMTTNFIMPNYVCAASAGEKMVSGLFYLIAYVGDATLSIMQRMMMGSGDLKEYGEYAIKYSPGLIFAGKIPMLDIDFIGADASNNKTITRGITDVNSKEDMLKLTDLLEKEDFESGLELGNTIKLEELAENVGAFIYEGDVVLVDQNSYSLSIKNFGNWGAMKRINKILPDGYKRSISSVCLYIYEGKLYLWETTRGFSGKTCIYPCDLSKVSNAKENIYLKSTAYELKSTIAKWYIALRTIALVGLLSVLVYIGIRIILSSSSAQDKAKYKNMLKDWLVAICILFVLHYVMSFLLSVSNRLNGIIINNVVGKTTEGNNTDTLMTEVRKQIGENLDNASIGNTAGYTIMYLALVILTGMFTVQYLKRVVYMAFLTMIAPMIALTYPLDKIKDSKAQAFDFWLKEYIFNCILQTVHLLMYSILIASAFDFAKANILYAIVAMGFMVPAEKIIKEMFGLKSKTSSGTLGAAAGGALVMSMMNKLKSKGLKGDKGGQEPSGVRTATRTPSSDGAAAVPQNQVPMAQNASAGGTKTATAKTGTGGTGSGTGSSQKTNSTQPQASTNNGSSTAQSRNRYSIGRGIGEITGVNSLISAPGRTFKNVGKKLVKAGGALGVAALGGSVMLANEIADGHLFDDPEKAVSNIAGAGVAGYMAGQGLEGRLGESVEKFNRGAMGEEAYNNSRFDKQFYASKGYRDIAQDSGVKSMCKQMGVSVYTATQQVLDNGITDASQIKMALQNGLNGDTFAEYSKQGITSPTDVVELMQNGIGVQNLKDIKTYGGETDAKKMMRYNTIAKAAKSDGVPQNETAFINWARTKHKMDDEEAKKLFKNVKFYWN